MASKTGPGKSYRKGLSLIEAFRKFPDDATAEAWLADCRWGDEPACPHCGDTNVQTGAKHPTMPYRCRGCRKRFSVRIGTAMQDSNIPLQKWAIAIYLMTTSLKGVSSMKLHRDLGIAQSSAWHMAHRLREAWARQGGLFAGPVEVDEAFFGGLEGNKHKSKKLNVGGGTGGKVPVIGAKDRDSNKVAARVIENTDKATVTEFVEKHADPDAKVYTDGASTYKGRKQEKVKHSVGEFVRGQAHINGMESFWAMLKRGYTGVYHRMSEKHLQRYVNEFAGRHNIRPLDTLAQMRAIVRGLEGRRLRKADLVA
ncbi:MAG: IS1595 family transposase [Gammaproteobacteria bacterium]|nr:IS1595 family transposase [Gammaproteobacteria bacterium]MDE0258407.1 IS1595 family transposase [Gammaproteobacteria bacterium]